MNDTIKLVPTRPDTEIAAELKQEIIKACDPLIEILDKANKQGFNVNVHWGLGPMGKMMLINLIIAKHF